MQATIQRVVFAMPLPTVMDVGGSSVTSYSIDVSGTGSLTGLAYTVPAHATGSVKAKLSLMALTSIDIKNLNDMAMGFLSASKQQEIHEYEHTHSSANLSVWSWFFGGGGASASFDKTKDSMTKLGLTEAQITMLMEQFLSLTKKMNKVEIDFTINNSANDYSVSGNLYLYTLGGNIQTKDGSAQYRMLADSGSAGFPSGQGGAPSEGTIIPLN